MIKLAYIRELLRARAKSIIIILVLVFIDICMYFFNNFYLSPTLVTLQNEWFSKRKVAGTVLDRGAAYDKGLKDVAKWRTLISPKKDLARIVGEIYETAKSNSLTVGSISYKPEINKAEKLLVYTIGLTVNGKYASIKSFIADVSRMTDIVTIDGISLDNPKLTEENISLKLNLTIYLRMVGA